MLGLSLGLMLAAAALTLTMQQAVALRELGMRVRVLQDRHSLADFVRRELRLAGLRQTNGPSSAHDQLLISGSDGNRQVQYRIDTPSGQRPAATPASSPALRLSAGVLQHRITATSGFQALSDTGTAVIKGWQLEVEDAPDCGVLLRSRMTWTGLPAGLDQAVQESVARRRNHGLLACEQP